MVVLVAVTPTPVALGVCLREMASVHQKCGKSIQKFYDLRNAWRTLGVIDIPERSRQPTSTAYVESTYICLGALSSSPPLNVEQLVQAENMVRGAVHIIVRLVALNRMVNGVLYGGGSPAFMGTSERSH